jgi:uncharacterized pyridoxal phosphate-containing UPF0001 family protein
MASYRTPPDNKVKYIVPVVSLIHSVDSTRLISAIDGEALKAGKKMNILLQIRIAREETKFGLHTEEAVNIANLYKQGSFGNVAIRGLMGMATLTGDEGEIRSNSPSLLIFSAAEKYGV